MTMTLHHGTSSSTLPLHPGLCLTPDDDRAREYGGYDDNGLRHIHAAELDTSSLSIIDVDRYDRDSDVAPGDNDEDYGADVIIYDDETPCAHRHATWRLMTPAAVAALAWTSTQTEER